MELLNTAVPFLLKSKVCYKEDEDDEKEPSWEKQEAMVRRLQKKFPDQDKEVRQTFTVEVTYKVDSLH